MIEGWLKIHRKMRDSLAGSSAIATGIWVHILLRAAHSAVILNNGQSLEAGELLISETGFADDMKVSRKVMRRVLSEFEKNGMLNVVKRDRNGTKLSVCNWSTYQDSEKQKGQQRNSNGTATELKRNSNERQSKNEKNEKNERRGKFTPPSVEEVREYMTSMGYPLDPEAFVASYQRSGWKLSSGRPMTCWKSSVVTWEKNRVKWEAEKRQQQLASRPKDVALNF